MKEKQVEIFTELKNCLPHNRSNFNVKQEDFESLKSISSVVLGIVAVAGLAGIAVVAPNALQVIGFLQKHRKSFKPWKKEEAYKKLGQTFYYMKRSGMIEFKQSGKEWLVSLTQKGKDRVAKIFKYNFMPAKTVSWNHTWWLIAADIPTKEFRQSADILRIKLRQADFYPLQRTLWLYPHNPVKELNNLASALGIGNFVTVMEIKKLDKDDEQKVEKFFQHLKYI